jgi:Rps23 Pro-64 3,4-dihydroxylase Tpa1-like proline 4-hydroxylase
VLQLQRRRTAIDFTPESLASAQEHFRNFAYLKLPAFVERSLLGQLMDALDRTEFYERVHPGIGTELCARQGAVTGALELMMNDCALRSFIAQLTACGPIGCYEGRVYRLNPADGHYDSWHSDVGEDRQLAVSINLSRRPFQGGRLQIRRADSEEILADVDNPATGDAVMFLVHPSMRHRVASVTGDNARTAWAGWFRSAPKYADLLRSKLT